MIAHKQPQRERLGEMLQFVTFDLIHTPEETITMALNVQKVKEVVELRELSPMPSACGNLLGVYDLRGCPVPVINVLSKIADSGKTHSYDEGARILICELQNVWVGVPVERTGRIFTCPSADFLPPPIGTDSEAPKIITGLLRKESGYVPVLDLDSLLDSLGFANRKVASEITAIYPGKRVLVVDDSKVILKKLDQLFTRLGCKVDFAENGSEALKKIDGGPRYDLIFTDIEMPVLDGIGMAREIKANPKYAQIPILFNSALSNPALISDIEKERLGRYLVKFDSDLIVKHLQIVFSSKGE